MPTVYLTRKETFNAAHQLWVPSWSEAENFATFGKCANKYYHGHNYDLYVTIKGQPDPLLGWLMDVKKLGDLIKTHICDVLDHSNLNMDESFLPKHLLPTTENLVIYIWKELAPHLPPNCRLHCIKLYETPKIYCEYYGEE
jgi:6-pyruvoyltetrahydropterin/6-carboxytetrahydropterin synthase